MNMQMQHHFSQAWLLNHVCSKIGEFQRSSVDARQLVWINNLALLVKIHRGLLAMGFRELDNCFIMPINIQKAYLDNSCVVKVKDQSCNIDIPLPDRTYSQAAPRVQKPLASGAIPAGEVGAFPIEEIASKDTKMIEGFLEDLYLLWQQDINKLKCFKGSRNISATFSSLLVVPSQVIDFRCSEESPKVLITSAVDDANTLVSIYVRMVDTTAASRLFDLLTAQSGRAIRRTFEKK